MRRAAARPAAILAAATVLAAIGVASFAAEPSKRKEVTVLPAIRGCSGSSIAQFPGAFGDSRNFRVGPTVIVGGAEVGGMKPSQVRLVGRDGFKMPFLLRAGRRVTLRIRPAGRRNVRLDYGVRRDARPHLGTLPYEITFIACSRGQRGNSDVDGKPVTFWSGGFVFRDVPVCVPLEFVIDAETPVRRVLSLADRRCRRKH